MERGKGVAMEFLLKRYAKFFALGALAISVALMGYIINEISQAKRQFADQLITKSVIQTENELDHFFNRISHLINATGQQYRTGYWEGLSERKTILHHISLIENYDPISSIGIADLRGYEMNIIPDSSAEGWLTRQVFVDRWGYTERWKRWRLDDTLTLVEQWEDSLSIDTRQRPWFKGAVRAAGNIHWTAPYRYTTGPEIGITASLLPQQSGPDSLSRIIAYDLTLNDLDRFVSDLHLTKNQNLFLLNGSNSRVLAHHSYTPDMGLAELDTALFVSPDRLESSTLISVLEEENNRKAFSFQSGGETWWGILRPYAITGSQTVNIVSVLPERDFALAINRTQWTVVGAFFLILILSLIVVWNHNSLHRIGNVLSKKNNLISDQKRILFSEVHHRVKNNLALISAFLDLDLLDLEDEESGEYLRKNRRRVKVIAIVQETAYKSSELGKVPAGKLVSEMLSYSGDQYNEKAFKLSSDEVSVNINQALTYGLLINELLTGLGKSRDGNGTAGTQTGITITADNARLRTRFSPPTHRDAETLGRLLQSDICRALLSQLRATAETGKGEKPGCHITFEMEDRKGIAGNNTYRFAAE